MEREMTDETFIGYCEIHCQTERSLFNGAQIKRIVALAQSDIDVKIKDDEWYPLRQTMSDLCKEARQHLAKEVTQ